VALAGGPTRHREVWSVNNPAFDYFEKIFCINLDSRPERWADIQKVFEKVGILDRVERLSGNKGHIAGWENVDGCALSHLSAIYYAKQHNLKNVLVFEDDIVLERPNLDDLPETIRSLAGLDWKLFYLGANIELDLGKRLGIEVPAISVNPYLYKVEVPVSTAHAIAYNNTAYDAILSSPYFKLDFENFRIIDHKPDEDVPIVSWDDLLALKIPDKYCVKDFVFLQKKGHSDSNDEVTDWSKHCRWNLRRLKRIMWWRSLRQAVFPGRAD
jgi:hypothetical protein